MHSQRVHFLRDLELARQMRAQRQMHEQRRAVVDRIATVIVGGICASAAGFVLLGIAAVVRWAV